MKQFYWFDICMDNLEYKAFTMTVLLYDVCLQGLYQCPEEVTGFIEIPSVTTGSEDVARVACL